MKKYTPVIVLAAVAVVCALAVWRSNSGRVPPAEKGPTEAPVVEPSPAVQPVQPIAEGSPEAATDSSPEESSASDSAAAPSVETKPKAVAPAAVATASAPAKASAAKKDPIDPETADLTDPEVLDRLLKQSGGAAALYKQLSPDRRKDLITALWSENKMRDEIGSLLPVADDSKNRAEMISQTHPREADPTSGSDDLAPDKGLMTILDQQTDSPIGRDEMIARMNLASEIDPEYGLKWAQNAKEAFPSDKAINLKAQSEVLSDSASIGNADPGDVTQAEDDITAMSQQDDWTTEFTAFDRIESYYAMFHASDPQKAKAFYENALKKEPDPDAQAVLKDLIGLIDKGS